MKYQFVLSCIQEFVPLPLKSASFPLPPNNQQQSIPLLPSIYSYPSSAPPLLPCPSDSMFAYPLPSLMALACKTGTSSTPAPQGSDKGDGAIICLISLLAEGWGLLEAGAAWRRGLRAETASIIRQNLVSLRHFHWRRARMQEHGRSCCRPAEPERRPVRQPPSRV